MATRETAVSFCSVSYLSQLIGGKYSERNKLRGVIGNGKHLDLVLKALTVAERVPQFGYPLFQSVPKSFR